MFKMIEVVGSSPENFSKAVKDAVNEVLAAGEKVHFFEVVEQRGAVRDGKFKEFQVKLKVAVEARDAAKKTVEQGGHFCPTCQRPAGEGGHMCVPSILKDEKCDWCGALIPDARHLCDEKVRELAYVCQSCGRTAVSADNLCNPRKIK